MDALLAFIGEHRFVLPAQAGALLGTSEEAARAQLRELADAGYLIEQPVLTGRPVTYRVTRRGLDVIGSRLRALPISLTNYWHDVGAAWLWLAAGNGAFGPAREVLAERVMRSRDARGGDARLGVRLGGVGRDGRERLHYPDLLLVDRAGRRVAIELEITAKSPSAREKILAGYAADPRIDKVVYVVYKPQVHTRCAGPCRVWGSRRWSRFTWCDSLTARHPMPAARVGSRARVSGGSES